MAEVFDWHESRPLVVALTGIASVHLSAGYRRLKSSFRPVRPLSARPRQPHLRLYKDC